MMRAHNKGSPNMSSPSDSQAAGPPPRPARSSAVRCLSVGLCPWVPVPEFLRVGVKEGLALHVALTLYILQTRLGPAENPAQLIHGPFCGNKEKHEEVQ